MPHIHEKIDFVAEAYVVYKGRVLLRRHDKYRMWFPPGGHVELDEDPPQAAIRELKEEVNLDITIVPVAPLRDFKDENSRDINPPRFMNRHRINETHEHVAMIYFATAANDEIRQGEKEVSEAIHWFTEDELDDPSYGITNRIKYYAHAALEALS